MIRSNRAAEEYIELHVTFPLLSCNLVPNVLFTSYTIKKFDLVFSSQLLATECILPHDSMKAIEEIFCKINQMQLIGCGAIRKLIMY